MFALAMAFTTVPTPLWPLYAQRDGFSSLIITVAFAYLGLSIPVIGLGVLTQLASTRVSMLVFRGLLGVAILAATPALLGRRTVRPSSRPQPTST